MRELAGTVFGDARVVILEHLPGADVIHTGATSLPGVLTRGDVDIHVRVSPAEFDDSCAELGRLYEADMRAEGFATFLIASERRLPSGIALTARGGEHDRRFADAWKRLARDHALVEEYNALKRRYEGTEDDVGYRAAKTAFFNRLEDSAS